MNTPCFLIPIIVGLISALLGYLLGKMMSGGNDLNLKSKLNASTIENEKLTNQLYLLEKDLNATKEGGNSKSLHDELDKCKANSRELLTTISSLRTEIDMLRAKQSSSHLFVSTEVEIPFDADLAESIMGKKIKENDLKIVEGIGPKIEELYHNYGIKTWKELSETSVEQSKEILIEAGERFVIHNPLTWAKQALLAYQGKWQELKDWQDGLNAGKE